MNASNQEELENRLRALTESLIQKQTALESLSTEKNSLIVQMERLEVCNSHASTTSIVPLQHSPQHYYTHHTTTTSSTPQLHLPHHFYTHLSPCRWKVLRSELVLIGYIAK